MSQLYKVSNNANMEGVSVKETIHIKEYSDDGHGWAAVKLSLLETLGITKQISPYSYQKGQTVYLEEDCDYEIFINAVLKMYGSYTKEHSNTNGISPIRSYPRYHNPNYISPFTKF